MKYEKPEDFPNYDSRAASLLKQIMERKLPDEVVSRCPGCASLFIGPIRSHLCGRPIWTRTLIEYTPRSIDK